MSLIRDGDIIFDYTKTWQVVFLSKMVRWCGKLENWKIQNVLTTNLLYSILYLNTNMTHSLKYFFEKLYRDGDNIFFELIMSIFDK